MILIMDSSRGGGGVPYLRCRQSLEKDGSEYDDGAERWDGGECLSHCYTAVKRNHDRSDTGERSA